MTNFQNGFFAIVLQDKIAIDDTIRVNNCGIINCSYPASNAIYEENFNYFYKEHIETPNFLTTRKRLFYRGLYYRPGFLTNINGKRVIVNQIGKRTEMKRKIEIDSPIFDKLLERVDQECH